MRFLLPALGVFSALVAVSTPAAQTQSIPDAQLRDVVGLVPGESNDALAFVRVVTRHCTRRVKQLETDAGIGAGIAAGSGRPGTLWIATADSVIQRDARTGARIASHALPVGIRGSGSPIRGICSDPSQDDLYLCDSTHRLWRHAVDDRRAQPIPVAGWDRDWIHREHRIVGLALAPTLQWLFAAVREKEKGHVLCFDLTKRELVGLFAIPQCACAETMSLTGIAWDTNTQLLYVTDGDNTISSRLAHDATRGWRLDIHHFCENQKIELRGLAVATEPAQSKIAAATTLGTRAPLVMQGARRSAGFVTIESGRAHRLIMRPVGGGAEMSLRLPRSSTLIGLRTTVRWRSRTAASVPLRFTLRR